MGGNFRIPGERWTQSLEEWERVLERRKTRKEFLKQELSYCADLRRLAKIIADLDQSIARLESVICEHRAIVKKKKKKKKKSFVYFWPEPSLI